MNRIESNRIKSNQIESKFKSNRNKSKQVESKFKSSQIESNQIEWNLVKPRGVKCLKAYLRYCQHATIQMGIEIVGVPKFVDLHGKRWLVSPNFSFSVSNLEHRWWKLPHPRSKQPRWFAVRGHYGILKPETKLKIQISISFSSFKQPIRISNFCNECFFKIKVLNWHHNTPKNANITLYINKIKTLCNNLFWGKLKFGIRKIGCSMSWTK